MKSNGCTLWLLPTGQAYDKFSNLIEKLAKENNAPVFQPHITLLGEILLPEEEVINKTKQLILNTKPFVVNLQQIDYEDYYFRTLFVRAEITAFLLAFHNQTKELFQIQAKPYMPHLSILYGNFPQEKKDKIISEIGKDQSAQFEVSSIHLVKGGEIKNWQIIGEFPFKPS